MDKIEERAIKFLTENGVKNSGKIAFYSVILANFAKQEREAVRAEIADLISELNDISDTRKLYFEQEPKIKIEFVLKHLNRILESLKGDE